MAQLLDANAAAGIVVPGMEKGACQDIWNAGLKHYVDGWWRRPGGWKFVTRFFPVFVKKIPNSKQSFNCNVKTEMDKWVLVTLPERDTMAAYLKSIPIWKDLESLPDGLYTWIFYHRAASPVQFAATTTWSALEMGTTHLAIASRVGASAVHGAGELRKSGDTYTYNLLSGTFTGEWKKKMKGECTPDALESYIDTEFRLQFPDAELSRTDATLITQDLPITQAEIDTYTRAGWTFEKFDTKEECLVEMNKKGGRRTTRRGGANKAKSEAQEILRRKQIEAVQRARDVELHDVVRSITRSGRENRPHWARPSEQKQERLSELLHRNDRLLAMGKGRRSTRRK